MPAILVPVFIYFGHEHAILAFIDWLRMDLHFAAAECVPSVDRQIYVVSRQDSALPDFRKALYCLLRRDQRAIPSEIRGSALGGGGMSLLTQAMQGNHQGALAFRLSASGLVLCCVTHAVIGFRAVGPLCCVLER